MRHPSRPVRRLARVVGAIVAVLALAGPVAAKSPVDPNTLNPPPPDFFNATCEQTGGHILCNLAFSDPDIVDEPSRDRLRLDGAPVLAAALGHRQAVLRRRRQPDPSSLP